MQFFNSLQERNIQDKLISLIEQAQKSLKIAVTWFTNHAIFEVILNKLNIPNFQVDLIVLNDRINNKIEGVEYQRMIDKGGNFYFSNTDNMVHHKFCVIDDEIVVTGSYNWTYYAEQRNWENVLVIQNSEVVKAYLEEFKKIKEHHERVENVSSKMRLDFSMNTSEYLMSDYSLQAQNERQKGNDLGVAKIYTQILRINNKQPEIKKARSEIIQRINSQNFETCPFEIGIHFFTGYRMVIPAFVRLPFIESGVGKDPVGGCQSLRITIQKYDFNYTTLHNFSMRNLNPCPIHTEKIKYTFTVEKNGFLTVTCVELNGHSGSQTHQIDLRKFQ